MSDLNISAIVEAVVRQMANSQPNNQTAQQPPITDVTLKAAVRLIEQIEKKARSLGVNAVIAVANKGARPVAVHCMDDSYIASYDVAFNKAYTCAALKMPTTTLKQLCQPGGELYGIQHTNEGRIIVFGGGVPIEYDGIVIGGLGVSGGSESQDTFLAQYGEQILKEFPDSIFYT
ncbi:heme-binding protein [Lachnospiraceae bacterium ZAX-1]